MRVLKTTHQIAKVETDKLETEQAHSSHKYPVIIALALQYRTLQMLFQAAVSVWSTYH